MSIREFVSARLLGRIRFSEYRRFTVCRLELVAPQVECRRCHGRYHVLYTRRFMRSDCGAEHTVYPGEEIEPEGDPYRASRNFHLAQKHFPTELKQLRLRLEWRYSETLKRSYWCFCCPRCRTFIGAHFFGDVIGEAESVPLAAFCSVELPCREQSPDPHWCFAQTGRYCGTE